MSDRILKNEEALRNIPPHMLRLYLLRSGWKERKLENPHLVAYQEPSFDGHENDLEVLVPTTSEVAGYADMVRRVVHLLAAFQHRAADHVAIQAGQVADILTVRLSDEATRRGSIPFGDFRQVVNRLRDLVLFAFSSELSAQRHIPRRMKEASELADKCEVGQTDYGSFVTTVVLPLPTPPETSVSYSSTLNTPINRRALSRVMTGLGSLQRASQGGDIRPLVDGYETGFNANMCEALESLLGRFPDGYVQFATSFDPGWHGSDNVPSEVTLPGDSRRILGLAADALRDVPIDRPVAKIAWVYQLQSEAGFRKGQPRRVGLIWEERGTVFRASATLSKPEYHRALAAHSREEPVYVEGYLEKHGTKWYFGTISLSLAD